MKYIFIVLFMSQLALAGFGGSRGGSVSRSSTPSSSFGGSRSYTAPRTSTFGGSRSAPSSSSSTPSFGGSRSSGQPATINRPPQQQQAPSSPTHSTTVIHQGGGGYSGPGFFSGLLMGNLLSHPAPVVVNGMGMDQMGAPVQMVGTNHGFFYYFFGTLFTLLFIGVIILILVRIF